MDDTGPNEMPYFTFKKSLRHYDNLIRLQTFGAPEVKAIKISVDTTSESVFGFSPIY